MLKYFSRQANLTEVLKLIKGKNPRLIITEYNVLVDNRMMKRDDDDPLFVSEMLNELISDSHTIEFKVIDNKFTLDEMVDGLKVNNLFQPILAQDEIKFDFLKMYEPVILSEGLIWSVELDDYKKNNFLFSYINEDPFLSVDVYLLFSTLSGALSFLLVNQVRPNVKVIVFDMHNRYNETLKEDILSLLQGEA